MFGFNSHSNSNNNFARDNYNLNTSHPLITNSQEYMYYKKYISIHSEDRDILKYPSSAEFEIELPEDYNNVSLLKLIQWTFPANYNTFSSNNGNVLLAFKISDPYNPTEYAPGDLLNIRIFEALFISNKEYGIIIEEGFYNPGQKLTQPQLYTTLQSIQSVKD